MNEVELIDILRSVLTDGADLYAPLRVDDVRFDEAVVDTDGQRWEADASCDLVWAGKKVRCLLEAKARATPKLVADATARLKRISMLEEPNVEPVLVVPYLSRGIAEQLEQYGVSGLDLNGNYLLLTDDLVAIRLDQPNAYPQSRDIKKVYSYNSSIVGRYLLVENRVFEQVNEIYEGIQERGGGISLSTVSKVLKGLDDEMIISKKRGEIRLLQPEKLLDRLEDGYREPRTGRRMELKLPEGEAADVLREVLGSENWIWSGEASAEAYATTTPVKVRTAYTKGLATARDAFRDFEDRRFYNCILEQTDDDYVYFDRREEWASPVEAYLALFQMDKREREIARSIRDNVIMTEWETNA